MRILLTNDDGIDARGLEVLREIASHISDDIWVVAPATEQSATSRSVSLHHPVRIDQRGEKEFAINGTPTDCVIMAFTVILKDHPPDLVLSGVNRGQNMAEDVTYSGTVAGAFQAMQMGVPAMALSLARGFQGARSLPWETAIAHGPKLIQELLNKGWPKDVILNINFPDRAPDDVSGLKYSSVGQRDHNLQGTQKRSHPRGGDYYWLIYGGALSNPKDGTDLKAIYDGYISVSPLMLDLTDHKTLSQLRGEDA